jgi:hypothetical protein
MTDVPDGIDLEPDRVVELLRVFDYEAVVGCRESQHLEFKESWYRFDDDEREKWELAKDVGAMANSGGGTIIRGVAIVKVPFVDEDRASKVKPLPADKVSLKQHRDVVAHWLFPAPKGVVFEWVPADPDGEDGGKGLLVIDVPAQDPDRGPFICTAAFGYPDKHGKERKVTTVSVPVRDGAHTDWEPPGVVWRDLGDGRRHRTSPTGGAPSSASSAATATNLAENAQALVSDVEQFMGWGDGATFGLVAIPTGPPGSPPSDLYAVDGLAGALGNPPKLHHAGFNLSYDEKPERIGDALVVNAGRERCLWLQPDGRLAAAINAQGEMLSWSYRRDPDSPGAAAINHLVLTEYTFLFTRFVHQQLMPRYGSYTYVTVILGARDREWRLTLPNRHPRDLGIGEGSPTGNAMATVVPARDDAESDAYALVATVFDFFGLQRELMSFAADGKINPSTFR